MDPILEYLLDFNKVNPIEYRGRFLIPPRGLEKMLDDYRGFKLNKEEVIKPLVDKVPEPEKLKEKTIEDLYNLLD